MSEGGVTMPSRTTQVQSDVLEGLVDTIAPLVSTPVDELHVAALLESRGVTDRLARERYGHRDVFSLAVTIMPDLSAREPEPAPLPRVPAWRPLVHGPLYLAPSVVFPAVLATGNRRELLIGLIAATVIGWLWGTVISVVAYQLRGQMRESAAAGAVQVMILIGLGLAVAGAAALHLFGLVGLVVVGAMTVQTAFQLGAGVLAFYQQEWLLAAVVLPAVTAGIIYLLTGQRAALVGPVLAAAALSAALTVACAWWRTYRARRVPDDSGGPVHTSRLRALGPAVIYAGACAVLLLYTNARFFTSGPDLALAAAPLILGMGAVEWRAERFVETGTRLTRSTSDIAAYRRRLWVVLLGEFCAVIAILGVVDALFIAMLHRNGVLTPAGTVLVAAYAVLGAVFFLGFVLARHAHFPFIVPVLATVVAGYVAAVGALAGPTQSNTVIALFLATTVTLVLVLLAAFAASSRQSQSFIW